MKKSVLIVFISLLSITCSQKISSSDINKINGYWEIESVVFPDGTHKEYSINETFDYFDVKNNKGFRKKVAPQLDGTFLVNNASEKVEIKAEKDKYFIFYNTAFNKWKEEIVSLSDDELVILNDSKNEYHYKRAEPINLLGDGKKTK